MGQPAGQSPGQSTGRASETGGLNGKIWLIEPAFAPSAPIWQGRTVWRLAVIADSAAFARFEADRWAGSVSVDDPLTAGFEDSMLYRVRPAPSDLRPRFGIGKVAVLEGPIRASMR